MVHDWILVLVAIIGSLPGIITAIALILQRKEVKELTTRVEITHEAVNHLNLINLQHRQEEGRLQGIAEQRDKTP